MTLVASLVLHLSCIVALIAIPLALFDKLPEQELLTFLYQPPGLPASPAPPPPPVFSPPQLKTVITNYYVVPKELPRSIPPPDIGEMPIIDQGLASSLSIGTTSGVSGGSHSGIFEGYLGNLPPPPPPPKPIQAVSLPTAMPRPKPIFVGGDIQQAKLIHQESVIYPDLALKAHISGIVLLRIMVDEEGKVSDVKVLSGHPLLQSAAVDSVRRWTYAPTLLNGHPVPVIATVAVNFTLQ